MRFSTRQLLLYVGGVAVWFGSIATGHNLFGSYGAVTFGLLFGISIFASVKIVLRWSKWTYAERGMSVLVLILSLSSVIYLTHLSFVYGFDNVHHKVKNAGRLQELLNADVRFQSVLVSYEDPRDSKRNWLWVRGSVANQKYLKALHKIISKNDSWRMEHIEWDVNVVVPPENSIH